MLDARQVTGHPYQPKPPYLYRVLMPEAGPAAIAVCLPNEINYCWDAGSCRLRYAWSGEFLDLMDYWIVKGELHAKVLGIVFYQDKMSFPFKFDEDESDLVVEFKGYRLMRWFPEFHYQINDIDVFELLTSNEQGSLIRRFKFENMIHDLWFIHADEDGTRYEATKGIWNNNRLKLNAKEASDFTITMLKSRSMNLPLIILYFLFFLISACQINESNDESEGSFIVEDITLPEGLVGETGAIGFLPDGRLVGLFFKRGGHDLRSLKKRLECVCQWTSRALGFIDR